MDTSELIVKRSIHAKTGAVTFFSVTASANRLCEMGSTKQHVDVMLATGDSTVNDQLDVSYVTMGSPHV